MARVGSLDIAPAAAADEFPVLALGEVVEADERTDIVTGQGKLVASTSRQRSPQIRHRGGLYIRDQSVGV